MKGNFNILAFLLKIFTKGKWEVVLTVLKEF